MLWHPGLGPTEMAKPRGLRYPPSLTGLRQDKSKSLPIETMRRAPPCVSDALRALRLVSFQRCFDRQRLILSAQLRHS